MICLETAQRVVEELYHDSLFSSKLEGCKHDCREDCACSFLKDRIAQNLRMVLCDVIVLKSYQEDNMILKYCPRIHNE